jgi:hypothetical protein
MFFAAEIEVNSNDRARCKKITFSVAAIRTWIEKSSLTTTIGVNRMME